jgi:AraC family transcriptional regulator
MRIPQGEPIAVRASGFEKYGSSGVLASSTDRGWSGLSAELRCHGSGLIAWKNTHDTEMCIDLCGNGSVITRYCGGVFDRTMAERGTIWLSPPGLQGDFNIDISDPVPGILHIYLSSSHFSPSGLGIDLDTTGIASPSYLRSFQDPLLAEIAYAIASELRVETSGGRLLAETLASSLAARLIQNHFCRSDVRAIPRITPEGLDRRRLSRVLDYISANLEGDLTIDRLASIACLSRFHFARAFKAAVGLSPHRYVSAKRLERAKVLLTRGDRSLVEIALALNFSCQANFTRAFRQVTGQSPSQYRRKTQR